MNQQNKVYFIDLFFICRKIHQRALESLQASLDVEVKGRTEGARLKKKMESDINELGLQVDLLNKNNAELMKTVKKMQQQNKVFPPPHFFATVQCTGCFLIFNTTL